MRLQAFIALNLSFLLKDPKILQFLNNLCRILCVSISDLQTILIAKP